MFTKPLIILFICFGLITTNSIAEETIKYLVNIKMSPIDMAPILSKGTATDNQPFRRTRIIDANTSYIYIAVTPKTAAEKTFFSGLEAINKIMKISGMEIKNVYDSRRGGYYTEISTHAYNNLPADYGNDYSVKVSS